MIKIKSFKVIKDSLKKNVREKGEGLRNIKNTGR